MSQLRALYQWHKQVGNSMSHMTKPQTKVLSSFSFGVATIRRCTLSVVAEALYVLGKPDTVERRLQRFLANPRIDWSQCCKALASWVIGSLHGDGLIVLLVDETSLHDRLKVMAVSLAYRGRALPLAWWCYPQEQWPKGQVELIVDLLRWVAESIGHDREVLVQADRGIGNSPDLLRAIDGMGWYYLVRVAKNVRLKVDGGVPVSFESLIDKPGDRWCGPVYAFKKAGWIKCWAQAQWQQGHAEAWLLLTNYPDAQGSWYGMRMWEELAFRDFKTSGWQWQRSRVWKAEHANILWLVMAVAYVWVISMGTHVENSPMLKKELTRGKERRLSLFSLGLRYLQRRLSTGRRLICSLSLVADPPATSKSVVH